MSSVVAVVHLSVDWWEIIVVRTFTVTGERRVWEIPYRHRFDVINPRRELARNHTLCRPTIDTLVVVLLRNWDSDNAYDIE